MIPLREIVLGARVGDAASNAEVNGLVRRLDHRAARREALTRGELLARIEAAHANPALPERARALLAGSDPGRATDDELVGMLDELEILVEAFEERASQPES